MKKRQSIDGFIPKQSIKPIQTVKPAKKSSKIRQMISNKSKTSSSDLKVEPDIIDVKQIDLQVDPSPQQVKPKKSRKKLKLFILLFLIIVLLLGGFFGYRFLKTTNSVFKGNWLGFFSKNELKKDANNRTNLLIFGTEEDSERGADLGGYLTDTVMLASYSHDDNSIKLVSMPRDFWVDYGQACAAGYKGKINAIYQCYSDSGKNELAGAKALQNKVSEVFGLDIQYFAHVNFKAVTEMIDAIGGVEIVIESEDPRGIYDPASQGMRYPNGPTGLLNGREALRLMRARNSKGGYGLPNSNFDREKNQQKVIAALVNKVQSAGTLTNPAKVSNIMGVIERNIRTNVKTDEIRSAIDTAKKIDINNIKSISLITPGEMVVTTGNINGQSVVKPQGATLYDYSKIQKFLMRKMGNSSIIEEAAKIAIYNASEQAGLAAKNKDNLESKGFNVIEIGNVDHQSDVQFTIYQLSDNTPKTKAYLQKIYQNAEIITTKPDFVYDLTLDLIIVINQ